MKKIIIAVIIAAIISGLFIITRRASNNQPEKMTVLTEQQIEPYLNLKGWKVTFISCDMIRIPLRFTGSYLAFAEEMNKSGYKLDAHKGENVKRYTYSVDNYGESDIIAEILLTNENELICAALIQQKQDGFIKSIPFIS